MNLLQAMRDPNLFGPWFKSQDSWRTWESFIAALFALPMDEAQVDLFRTCTGGTVRQI